MSLMRMIVKVGIDATEYQLGIKKLESAVTSSMMSVGRSIAGAFTVGAVTAFTVKVAKAVADVADLADQLEITTDQVQALQRAALGSGVAFDAYASALQKVRKAQLDAKAGDKGANELFARLGVDPNQPSFDVLKKIGFTDDKAALFDLLGVRSAKLFNSLKDIRDLEPFERINDQIVRRTDSAFDRLAEMKRQVLAVAIGAGSGALSRAAPGKGTQSLTFREIVDRVMGRGGPKQPNTEEDELGWSPHRESEMMPGGYTRSGRSSGWAGPMPARVKERFSPIDLGDRASVGGFFGPNADINRSMQRNIESISKDMKEVSKVVVGAAQTAP